METFFIVLLILVGVNALLLAFSINTAKEQVEKTMGHGPEVGFPAQIQALKSGTTGVNTNYGDSKQQQRSCSSNPSETIYSQSMGIWSKNTVKSPISRSGDDGE